MSGSRVPRRPRPSLIIAATAVLLLAVTVTAIGLGAVQVSPGTVVGILAAKLGLAEPGAASAAMQTVVWNVRLPRVLMSLMTGAALACGGVLMQAFFRNPLADPALIGVSAGAALGAVTVIVLGATVLRGLAQVLGAFTLPLAAFAGGLASTLVVFRLSQRDGQVNATTMLLSGVAVNALTGAGIGFLSFLATDEQLRNLTFWSLGSMAAASWTTVSACAPFVLLMLLCAPMLSMRLNALLLGEAEALHLGIAVERLKLTVVLLASMAVGAVVALAGIIGFVGLVTPHLARLCVGPDHRKVLPLAAMLGAALLTGGDILARTAVRPAELPIGILTALVGAPFFLFLLRVRHGEVFRA